MIGYSDCLIDTTTTKLKEGASYDWVELPENWMTLSEKKKKSLLEQMRNTRVMGACSMDSRPRQHSLYIALLSAETANWSIFLRSHLDIINDHFERLSDASWGYGMRSTYIRELEELSINVSDLFFGITFRIDNPAQNHYFGSITRLGRALAETQHRTEVENEMIGMIKDPQLDYYNRVLIYFMFLNYNEYAEDEDMKEQNNKRLKSTLSSFPVFIGEKLERE
jgi:hypothetical protein